MSLNQIKLVINLPTILQEKGNMFGVIRLRALFSSIFRAGLIKFSQANINKGIMFCFGRKPSLRRQRRAFSFDK